MSDDRQARSNDLALLASEAALLAEKAALESQNQALQEENDRLGKMLVELNDAQVVQEKALLAIRDSKHAVPPVDASECRAIARDALSPTQETDHMADVMTYTDAGWPHGARCSRCGQLFTEGQVMAEELDSVRGDGVPVVEVSHRTCEPTQETDPE